MVAGVQRHDGQQLAPAPADANSDQPDEAIGEGRWAERRAHQTRGRLETDQREARHPVAEGLWTRRFGDAELLPAHGQDAGHRPEANPRHQKQLECQQHQVRFAVAGGGRALA